jgi:hypothetical protein
MRKRFYGGRRITANGAERDKIGKRLLVIGLQAEDVGTV